MPLEVRLNVIPREEPMPDDNTNPVVRVIRQARAAGHHPVLIEARLTDPKDDRFESPWFLAGWLTGYKRTADDGLPGGSEEAGGWRLTHIFVDEDWRRRGVATRALDVLKKTFPSVGASVPENNLAAQKLLRKAGAKCRKVHHVGRGPGRKTYYLFRWKEERAKKIEEPS